MKSGYKLTSAGMIPEDWDEKSVRSVCKLINGRGFKPHEWKRAGLPIIRIQNLNGSDEFNYFEGPYAKKLEVDVGQLLFAWSGSRGTSFGPHVWRGPLGLLNYHTWKVQVNDAAISRHFFLYALIQLTKFIEDRAHGASALVHTQKWEMESFTFPAPPTLAEQRAIAEALTDVDALLDALDRLIAKKRDLKQAAMQQLLSGQTRLPGHRGTWEIKRLGDLGATYGGLTGKTRADFGGGEARYITFMNVMANVIIDCTTFSRVTIRPTESQNGVRKGDLFFNGSSETPEEVAMCSVLLEEVQGVYLNSFCSGFRFKEGADADGLFFAYYMRGPKGRELMKSLAQGSTRYNLSKVALLNLALELPTLSEQAAIAGVLRDMDLELAGLERRREKTLAVKQGMMQELLTGGTRLVAESADA